MKKVISCDCSFFCAFHHFHVVQIPIIKAMIDNHLKKIHDNTPCLNKQS